MPLPLREPVAERHCEGVALALPPAREGEPLPLPLPQALGEVEADGEPLPLPLREAQLLALA